MTKPSHDPADPAPRPRRQRKRSPEGQQPRRRRSRKTTEAEPPGRKPRRRRPPASKTPQHLSARPSWDCLACGDAWPCAVARDELLNEFGPFPSLLNVYLNAQMHDAAEELIASGQKLPTNLFERFLAWARKDTPTVDGKFPTSRNGWPDNESVQAAA